MNGGQICPLCANTGTRTVTAIEPGGYRGYNLVPCELCAMQAVIGVVGMFLAIRERQSEAAVRDAYREGLLRAAKMCEIEARSKPNPGGPAWVAKALRYLAEPNGTR